MLEQGKFDLSLNILLDHKTETVYGNISEMNTQLEFF